MFHPCLLRRRPKHLPTSPTPRSSNRYAATIKATRLATRSRIDHLPILPIRHSRPEIPTKIHLKGPRLSEALSRFEKPGKTCFFIYFHFFENFACGLIPNICISQYDRPSATHRRHIASAHPSQPSGFHRAGDRYPAPCGSWPTVHTGRPGQSPGCHRIGDGCPAPCGYWPTARAFR